MNKYFKIEDLKTGMRVTCEKGGVYLVCKGAQVNGLTSPIIFVGCGLSSWRLPRHKEVIVKVENCFVSMSSCPEKHEQWTTIWELVEETSLQREFNQLQSQIRELQDKANSIQQQIK